MAQRHLPLRAPLGDLFGPAPSDARQSLAALSLGLLAALIAGITLGSISDTLEALPGLLVLAPAATSLRGNIFGALGARLSTSIHTGEFTLSARFETLVGQNLVASLVLNLAMSMALAFLVKAVAVGFGVADTISVLDFFVISVVGGVLSSLIVVGMTVALAAASVRYGWDADNVMAPLVTGAGDLVSLPSLYVATFLVDIPVVEWFTVGVSVAVLAVAVVRIIRSRRRTARRILVQSLPVLTVAGVMSLVAGVMLEHSVGSLLAFPALLALVPPFLSSTGAAGGILSSRLTSKLHLGLIEPRALPPRLARSDIGLTYTVAVAAFAIGSVLADLAAAAIGLATPGPADMLLVAVVGGLLATTVAVVIGYSTAIATFRMGLDPDNFAIPMVSSSLDLFGSLSFIIAVSMFVSGGGG